MLNLGSRRWLGIYCRFRPLDATIRKPASINTLNPELNPICYLLELLELTIFFTLAG